MLAATASADITPPIGVIAQGHSPAGPTHSVHLPLELRTIVFAQDDRHVAIIILDIIGIERLDKRKFSASPTEEALEIMVEGSIYLLECFCEAGSD